MLPEKGFKSITIKENVYNSYKQLVHDLSKISLKRVTLSELLEWFLEVYHYWPELPRLSKWSAYDDKVGIMDSKDMKIIEVQIKNGNLYCLEDDSHSCMHVGFALALPEISKVMSMEVFHKAKKTKKDLQQEIENAKLDNIVD